VAAADSVGYVMAHLAPGHLKGGDVDLYLCGPPPMVDAVRAWLAEQSVTPAKILAERRGRNERQVRLKAPASAQAPCG
jgi:NAD(P)H-flavin reductase